MASRKQFQNGRALWWKKWNWDSTLWRPVVLNIAAFLRECVVLGEGFRSKYKPWFTLECPSVRTLIGGCYLLVFRCLSDGRLSTFHSVVKIRSSVPRLSWPQVDEAWRRVSRKLLTAIFCSKLYSVKSSAQTRECREGREAILLIFMTSPVKFWVLGELQSAKFVFWVVFLGSSLWTWNQNSSKSPSFLELTDSDIINFISDNYPTIFPTALRLWGTAKSSFNILISPKCLVQLIWGFRLYLVYS